MQKNNMSQKQNKCISQELFKFLIKSLDFFFFLSKALSNMQKGKMQKN